MVWPAVPPRPWTQHAESNTQIWPSLVYGPGLDSHTGPCEKPAGTHHRSDCLVPSTLRGWTRRGWCMSSVTKGRHRHLATLHARAWALESDTIGLSRAAFVPLTLFLSSMRHHQVLCVLSACCLHFHQYEYDLSPTTYLFKPKYHLIY